MAAKNQRRDGMRVYPDGKAVVVESNNGAPVRLIKETALERAKAIYEMGDTKLARQVQEACDKLND